MQGEIKSGNVLLRFQSRVIEVDGDVRKLDHKAMQVLGYLVENAETTLTKRQILDRVWTQDFVSDEVLTVAISRLRRALGDQARAPRFIETVPQVGYRWIAPFDPPEPSPNPNPNSSISQSGEDQPRGRPRLVAAMFAGFLLTVGIVAWLRPSPPNPSEQPRRAHDIASLAVLPLTNLTGDHRQDFLAEGITEAWTTGLASRGDLRVASRALVRRFQRDRPDSAEVARQLGVDALLEGSLQRSGERLRLAVRLIDASGDEHLWAQTFDGELASILDLQEEALNTLQQQLEPRGLQRSNRSNRSEGTIDSLAYESYLRGRYLLAREPSLSRQLKAVRELERAIERQPSYLEAHVALAEAWLSLGESARVAPHRGFAKALAAAQRVLALDGNSAAGHALLGMVLFLHDWAFADAEQELRLAIQLDSNNILAHDGLSRLLTVMGRFDEALEYQRILGELNPLIYHRPFLAYIYNMARHHEQALMELRKQLEIAPGSAQLHSHLTSTYRWLDRSEEAMGSFQNYLMLSGASPQERQKIEAAFASSNITGASLEIFRYLDAIEARGREIPAMSRAEVLSIAGKKELAIQELLRAFDRREPELLRIGQSPDYDILRSDPRFRNLLGKIGLSNSNANPASS